MSAGTDPSSRSPFLLRFSTGETVLITGAGLLGRRPAPEPGEYFDQYVSVTDPGRSVSKTHLEFGIEDGGLWVLDRFSGNGTRVVEPGLPPRRCEPGRRCPVPRGARVEIGDQSFTVA